MTADVGDVRSQGINSHDIDLVKLRLLGSCTLRVNVMFPGKSIPIIKVRKPWDQFWNIYNKNILYGNSTM